MLLYKNKIYHVGVRLKELRQQRGLTLQDIANKSGVSVDIISALELDEIQKLDNSDLLKIIDSLNLNSAYDFLYLTKLNKHPLKFKAFNVGILKTGTQSIAHIFDSYSSIHEFMFQETAGMVIKYNNGQINKIEFVRFLKERNARGCLEMDSANVNSFYVDILAEEYPSAKFIFTIRDCFSWEDSLVNMYTHGVGGGPWVDDYTKLLFGFSQQVFNRMKKERHLFLENIDKMLSYWESANEDILRKLPKGRSLIIKTNEISHSIGRIADFIGVAETTLRKEVHKNKAIKKYRFLETFGLDVEDKFQRYCSKLMNRFFPNYTLKDYLKNDS